MIAAGTRIDFQVSGTTGQYWPRATQDVRQDAITELMAYVTVEDVNITRPGLLEDPWTFTTGLAWPYTASVRLVTNFAHADIADLDAIVAGAFQVATGERPVVTAQNYQPDQGPGLTTAGPSVGGVLAGLGAGTTIIAAAIAVLAIVALKKGLL